MIKLAGIRTIYDHALRHDSIIKIEEKSRKGIKIKVLYSSLLQSEHNLISMIKGHMVLLYPGMDPATEPTIEMIVDGYDTSERKDWLKRCMKILKNFIKSFLKRKVK